MAEEFKEKGKRMTKTELELLIKEMVKLLQGMGTSRFTIDEIAHKYNCAWRTANKAFIRAKKQIKMPTKKELSLEFSLNCNRIIKNAWFIAGNSESTNMEKIQALRLILDEIDKEINWRFKMGLIDVQPERIEHKLTLEKIMKVILTTNDRQEVVRLLSEGDNGT